MDMLSKLKQYQVFLTLNSFFKHAVQSAFIWFILIVKPNRYKMCANILPYSFLKEVSWNINLSTDHVCSFPPELSRKVRCLLKAL